MWKSAILPLATHHHRRPRSNENILFIIITANYIVYYTHHIGMQLTFQNRFVLSTYKHISTHIKSTQEANEFLTSHFCLNNSYICPHHILGSSRYPSLSLSVCLSTYRTPTIPFVFTSPSPCYPLSLSRSRSPSTSLTLFNPPHHPYYSPLQNINFCN